MMFKSCIPLIILENVIRQSLKAVHLFSKQSCTLYHIGQYFYDIKKNSRLSGEDRLMRPACHVT